MRCWRADSIGSIDRHLGCAHIIENRTDSVITLMWSKTSSSLSVSSHTSSDATTSIASSGYTAEGILLEVAVSGFSRPDGCGCN